MRGSAEKRGALDIIIARTLDEYQRALFVRSLVYVGEQHCPYDEEFDGNDLAGATHLLAQHGGRPLGTLRLRWFADFAKLERVAVIAEARNGETARALIEAATELAANKGYRRLIGHVEERLLVYWRKLKGVRVRPGRPRFCFSDREYIEIELELRPAANAISIDSPPLILLRPEGAWNNPGILDHSAARGGGASAEATWRR